MKFLAIILVVGVLVTPAAADTPHDKARAIYTNRLASIERKASDAYAGTMLVYKTELGYLKARFRRQGDLTGVLAVDRELQRCAVDRTIPVVVTNTIPAVSNLVVAMRARLHRSEQTKDFDTRRLRVQYVAELTRVKKALVTANRIPEAVKVEEELVAVKALVPPKKTPAARPKPVTPKKKLTLRKKPKLFNPVGKWLWNGRSQIEFEPGGRMIGASGQEHKWKSVSTNTVHVWINGRDLYVCSFSKDGNTYTATHDASGRKLRPGKRIR
jgi:hypothetical protein